MITVSFFAVVTCILALAWGDGKVALGSIGVIAILLCVRFLP